MIEFEYVGSPLYLDVARNPKSDENASFTIRSNPIFQALARTNSYLPKESYMSTETALPLYDQLPRGWAIPAGYSAVFFVGKCGERFCTTDAVPAGLLHDQGFLKLDDKSAYGI